MPIYHYKCSDCSDEKDLVRKVEERDDRLMCDAYYFNEDNLGGEPSCWGWMERTISQTAPPKFEGGESAGWTPKFHD